MKVINDFVWLLITEKAKEVFASGLFEVYRLYDDGTEKLCESFEDINEAMRARNDLAIEVGKI